MALPPAARNYDGWVAQLRRSRRRQQAKQLLSAAGPDALPAIRVTPADWRARVEGSRVVVDAGTDVIGPFDALC